VNSTSKLCKAASTLVTFRRTLARNHNKDDVICYAEICYGVLFGAIHSEHWETVHTDHNIFTNMFACHVRENVTSVGAALGLIWSSFTATAQ
jgi:hypothetical protein